MLKIPYATVMLGVAAGLIIKLLVWVGPYEAHFHQPFSIFAGTFAFVSLMFCLGSILFHNMD